MELTINYNHGALTNSEALGATKERWEEIKELLKDSIERDDLKYKSQEIEWILSQLKDVKPCDLVIVGYMLG